MLELLAIGSLCGVLAATGAFRWLGKAFWCLVILVWLSADPAGLLLWTGSAAACVLAWRLLKSAADEARAERLGR